MTPKQVAFVNNKLYGMSNKAAVVFAGYSPAGAKQMGTQLMKHPEIQKALKARGFTVPEANEKPTFRRSSERWRAVCSTMPKEVYSCPIEFLTDAMNCQEISIAERVKFAAALLPYQHAKVSK